MKTVCKQDNFLNEKINRFWDYDTIGISDNGDHTIGDRQQS